MKKVIAVLLTLTIFWGSSTTTAVAATNTTSVPMENFITRNSYIYNQFLDVNEVAWYGATQQGVIQRVYELNIMNGIGNKTFSPNGDLKICEAIKMAAVIRSVYNGDKVLFNSTGEPWYKDYVNYAISNGIISVNTFKDYNAHTTRAQMAYIFANALPASELQQINTINSISDATKSITNSDSIYSLYRAGVLTGDAGTRGFRPDSKISRAEAAAIVVRLVLPMNRQHFEILPANADLKSYAPKYAIYNKAGNSLALGYQPTNTLNTFFNSDPINNEKYGFTDATNIYLSEYQGFGKVRYLLSDYSAGGIYVYGISITSGDYKMKNGIHIGSTPQDLISTYGNALQFEGKSMWSEYDSYTYYPGDGSPWNSIYFSIDNGVVTKIDFGCSVY